VIEPGFNGEQQRVSGPVFTFDRFRLDCAERQLTRDGEVLDVSGRYLDALALMVREGGSLVTKDRFMDEVWRGVPVTDEALTQCVRSLRKALGDDAARPRFIETVPKHGYRFIAAVEACGGASPKAGAPGLVRPASWQPAAALAAGGTAGAAAAGVVGGILYGFAASQGVAGPGGASVLIVIVLVTLAVALLGGAGVSLGVAAARQLAGRTLAATVAGGAAGGLLIGAFFRLFGLDALQLLFGRAPDAIAGAGEGLVLGAATGLGAWLALRGSRERGLMRRMLSAGWVGAVAGAGIVLLGGRLLGGSLASLAARFPGSRLRLDSIGKLFGDNGYGPLSQLVTGAAEGALFAACVAGGMALAHAKPMLARPRRARDNGTGAIEEGEPG
jgi:DNA-binding winged helix-turn-helix (wHTH) protein